MGGVRRKLAEGGVGADRALPEPDLQSQAWRTRAGPPDHDVSSSGGGAGVEALSPGLLGEREGVLGAVPAPGIGRRPEDDGVGNPIGDLERHRADPLGLELSSGTGCRPAPPDRPPRTPRRAIGARSASEDTGIARSRATSTGSTRPLNPRGLEARDPRAHRTVVREPDGWPDLRGGPADLVLCPLDPPRPGGAGGRIEEPRAPRNAAGARISAAPSNVPVQRFRPGSQLVQAADHVQRTAVDERDLTSAPSTSRGKSRRRVTARAPRTRAPRGPPPPCSAERPPLGAHSAPEAREVPGPDAAHPTMTTRRAAGIVARFGIGGPMELVTTTACAPGDGRAPASRDQMVLLHAFGCSRWPTRPSGGDDGRVGARLALELVRGHVERNEDVIHGSAATRAPSCATRSSA